MSQHDSNEEKRSYADWWLLPIGFVLFLGLGLWATPAILYAEKPQPFKFSHKVHMEQVDEGCNTCHTFREDGSFSGIPKLASCIECHESPQGDTPEEKVLIEQYVKKNKPIPWQVYSKQPPCVFFSHAAHVKNAEMECAKCHGNHGETDELRPYQYNRLSTYSRDIWGPDIMSVVLHNPPDRMKMDDCAKCHRENGVRDACFVCHK